MTAYVALERGSIDHWDGLAMASVGRNLMQHGSLKECCRAFGAFPRDPGPYAKFGIGYSLLLAPLWHFQLITAPTGALWLGLANPLLLAASAACITQTGLVLGWRRSSAVLAALSFAFLTMAPIYSTSFFADPGVTFGSALVVLGFACWQQRSRYGALVIGVGAAISILFRPDAMVLLAPVLPLAVLFRSRDELVATWRSTTLKLGVPVGLALSWTLFYNWLRYHNAFQLGYRGYYDGQGFSTPIGRGVRLLLVSPGKSFFLFSPILLAAIPGIILLGRRRKAPLAIVIAVMFIVRVAFYARWWTPPGGHAWGPRFLLPLCAVLAIPLGEVFEHLHQLRAGARRAAICALMALSGGSAVVVLASLLVSYQAFFTALDDTKTVPPALRYAVLAHRHSAYIWTFSGNQITWSLSHIGSRAADMPLHWFSHGVKPIAIAMIASTTAALAGAIAVAHTSDRSEQHARQVADGA
jgi:hypothetical protein